MPIAYFEPIVAAYPESHLQVDYKGFKILKRMELNLYSIVPPEGKKLHRSLEGDFTKMELLKSTIDAFLSEHGSIHAAFTDIEVKRGRGRPKKHLTPLEQMANPYEDS